MPTPTPQLNCYLPTPTPFISPLPTPLFTASAGVTSFEAGDTLTMAVVLLLCVICLLLVRVYAKLNKKL